MDIVNIIKSIDLNEIKNELENNKSKKFNSKVIYDALNKYSSHIDTKNIIIDSWDKAITSMPSEHNNDWDNLFKAFDDLLKLIYPNPSTIKDILARMRKPLRNPKYDSKIYLFSKEKMGLSQAEHMKLRQQYDTKVNDRNQLIATLPLIYVEDVIELIVKLYNSTDKWQRTLSGLFATGLRFIEFFKLSKFEKIENEPNKILITGLAKVELNKELTFKRQILGLTADQVIELSNYVRTNFNLDGDNDKVVERYSFRFNKYFRAIIGNIIVSNGHTADELSAYVKSLTCHKTRYIYGNVLYILYGKDKKIPIESFIKEQLNHYSSDSTKSYLSINIEKKPEPVVEPVVVEPVVVEPVVVEPVVVEPVVVEPVVVEPVVVEPVVVEPVVVEPVVVETPPEVPDVDYKMYINTFEKKNTPEKIGKILNYLRLMKEAGIKKTQMQLRKELRYSGPVLTEAYKLARVEGLI
jgi:hypothetical protein